MRYIRTFESFKVNEEFIGNLFKKLKNKLSISLSKKFGTASDVDKLMEKYKEEVFTAWNKKKTILETIGKLQKSIYDSGDDVRGEDVKELEKTVKKLESVDELFKTEKSLIRKKFDIKFEEIIEEEKNKKVVNYINLKKIEMEQEILQNEYKVLLSDSGLTEKDIKKNNSLDQIIKKIDDRIKKSKELSDKEVSKIEEEDVNTFDFDAAKKNPENYNWTDSKFIDHKFEEGDEITYWKKDGTKEQGEDYQGTKAYVMPNDKQKNGDDTLKNNELRVSKTKDKEDKGFVIARTKIIK